MKPRCINEYLAFLFGMTLLLSCTPTAANLFWSGGECRRMPGGCDGAQVSASNTPVSVPVSAGSNSTPTRSSNDGDERHTLQAVGRECLDPRARPAIRSNACSFYRECLEQAIACVDTRWPYATGYGERYCLAFQELSPRLSSAAQQWISDTTYCLQELVPLWSSDASSTSSAPVMSCEEVYDAEFDGHADCYLGRESRTTHVTHTPICNLDISDLGRIFLTVRAADMFSLRGLFQMARVGETCAIMWTRLPGPARSDESQQKVEFWRSWQQWAQAAIAAQASSPPIGYSVPPGNYQQSCRSCGVDYYDHLACECPRINGEYVVTRMNDWRRCSSINNCYGALTCGACPPCGAQGQTCCDGLCRNVGVDRCIDGTCQVPACTNVGSPCCSGECHGTFCVNGLCQREPDTSRLHRVEVSFSDIDDDAYVWLADGPETRLCAVNQGPVPRHGECELTSQLNARRAWRSQIIIRLGNGGCFRTSGEISLKIDGTEVWHGTQNPVISHCGWQLMLRADIDLSTGTFHVVEESSCILSTDC